MRLLVVEHEATAGPELIGPALARGAALDVVRPYRGEAVPVLDDVPHDGLVVLGGEMAAWEDDVAPWLPAVRALLAEAARAELPTLGICLGAQLLAHATGGRAERGPAGLEIGRPTVTPLPAAAGDRFAAAALPGPVAPLSYHADAVTELPADAEVLATGEVYPVQVFRVGAAAWGVQYHPEVSGPAFAHWVREHPTLDGDAKAGLVAVAGAAGPDQARLAAGHAAAFLAASRSRPR